MTAEIHLTLINNLTSRDFYLEMREIYMLFVYISNSPSFRHAQVLVGCWGGVFLVYLQITFFLLLTREPIMNKGNVLSKTDKLTEKVVVLRDYIFSYIGNNFTALF